MFAVCTNGVLYLYRSFAQCLEILWIFTQLDSRPHKDPQCVFSNRYSVFPCSWKILSISGLWSFCTFKMFELYFCLQWSFQNSDSCKIHQKRRKRVSNIKVESWMRTTKSSFSSWETCAVSGTLSEELSKSPRTAQKRVVVRSSKSSKTCWSFSQLCNLRDLQGREKQERRRK